MKPQQSQFDNPDRSTRLEKGAVCSGSDCGKPATKFTWEGNLCEDCWGPGGKGR